LWYNLDPLPCATAKALCDTWSLRSPGMTEKKIVLAGNDNGKGYKASIN